MKKRITAGFTLIELTLYMALLGIFLVILSQMFVSILSVNTETEATSTTFQDGTYLISRLTNDIHRADAIVSPALASTSSTLQLVISEDGAGKLYTYAFSDPVLSMSDGTHTDRMHSIYTNIRNFSVKRLGNSDTKPGANDTLKISFGVESIGSPSGGTGRMDFQTAVGLR